MPEARFSFSALRIEALSLLVRLGCTREERAKPQEVRVTLELRFREPPKAMRTDLLSDTFCYAKGSALIKTHCESREYQLIERMAFEIYELIREMAGPGLAVGVSLHKVRPPVERLRGGTFFRCGDFVL